MMDVSSFVLFFVFVLRLVEEDRIRQCQRQHRMIQSIQRERFWRRQIIVSLIVLETTRRRSPTVWCTKNKFARYNKVQDNFNKWTSGDGV